MENEKLEYVGFWARLGATFLDAVLILVITYPLIFIIYGDEYFSSDDILQGPADFFISYILPAVAVIWFWYARQATPGKLAIGARIVDA